MSRNLEEQFLQEHIREECISHALANLGAVFDTVTEGTTTQERRDITAQILEHVREMVEPYLVRGA